jgi:excisionase family DNA binding protein
MRSTRTNHRKGRRTKHTNRPSGVAAMPELVTVPEVAAWLGVSQWSAYDMARRGVLPVVRLGRLVRIQRAGLEQLAGRQAIETGKAESRSTTGRPRRSIPASR